MTVYTSRRLPAYAALAAVCALPRLIVLLHERGAITANFTEKSDSFASTFVHGNGGSSREPEHGDSGAA